MRWVLARSIVTKCTNSKTFQSSYLNFIVNKSGHFLSKDLKILFSINKCKYLLNKPKCVYFTISLNKIKENSDRHCYKQKLIF